MRICHDKGGLTTQRMNNKVKERLSEIAQSMSIVNKQCTGPEQWDLVIDRCVTQISDLECKWPLWKWYNADMTNLDGENLKAALAEFADVGLHQRNDTLEETPTNKKKLVHIAAKFISLMLPLLFVMMCRSRRWQGRNLGSQAFADNGVLRRVSWFLHRAL